jgi:hypothetical protein
MEIVLTAEEIEREGWAAFDAWERECKRRETPPDSEARHSAYRAWCDDWLCRAQVKKADGTDRIAVCAWKGDDPFIYWVCGCFTWDRVKAIEDQLRENRSEYNLDPDEPTLVHYHIEVHDYGNETSLLCDVPIEDSRELDMAALKAAGEGK